MKLSEFDPENPIHCDVFWGSHGCGFPPGHDGPCFCINKEYGWEGEILELYSGDNCAPPYFGPDTEFMTNHDTPIPQQTLDARLLTERLEWP